MQSYGNVGMSAAIGTGIADIRQSNENEAQTGLFIKVRDIRFPEWQIEFADSKGRKFELKRWMQILTQCVEEGLQPDAR